MALYLALIVILIGCELILLNHILIGLILIGVYVGAIIILIVFVVMNSESPTGFSFSVFDLILVGFIVLLFKNESLLQDHPVNLGVLLFEEYSLFTFLLVFLLLITLVTSYKIIKRL